MKTNSEIKDEILLIVHTRLERAKKEMETETSFKLVKIGARIDELESLLQEINDIKTE